jgi:hypothetical protein
MKTMNLASLLSLADFMSTKGMGMKKQLLPTSLL